MKVQNPIIGRAKGSAGGMTFTKVYDKNVARAKAFEVSNPKTSAQVNNRQFFSAVTSVCTDISEEDLRALYPMKPKTMSRRNAITKQIAAYNEIVNGSKVIDFAAIDTLGNASVMDFGETNITNGVNAITVELDPSIKAMTQYADNYMLVVLVNETLGQIYCAPTNANIETGVLSIDYPSGWTSAHEIHPIPMMGDKKKNGDIPLVGFGTMGVQKRPSPGAGVTPPAPTPTPSTDIDVVATGLKAWDSFSVNLAGTAGEGGNPAKMQNGETIVASGFSHASGETYTGSFVSDVNPSLVTTLEVSMPNSATVSLVVNFVND